MWQVPDHYLSLYPAVDDTKRRTYLAMVTAMDAAVGAVKEALVANNMYNDTIVVFLSDNGADTGT